MTDDQIESLGIGGVSLHLDELVPPARVRAVHVGAFGFLHIYGTAVKDPEAAESSAA